jgi:hypothetical protein
LGFQEVEAPRFIDNQLMKAFTPQEIFLVLNSVKEAEAIV